MHARRYFVGAEPSHPRAVEALAFIRTLYAVEKELKDERARLDARFTNFAPSPLAARTGCRSVVTAVCPPLPYS